MKRDELHSQLKTLIENFRSTAHSSLARIGRSFGVECSAGHYDVVMSAARTARSGIINDDEGRLEYWFHGAGCEAISDSRVVDFNFYPKRGGISPIMAGAFGFKKFLDSMGIEIDEEALVRVLDEAAERGLVERLDAGRPYYLFSSGTR